MEFLTFWFCLVLVLFMGLPTLAVVLYCVAMPIIWTVAQVRMLFGLEP